jgi:type IV pilus assembly protein PilW
MYAPDHPLRAPASAAGQRGLSMIELMVGIVVSLLVGLAATSTAVSFTASQRQGIGAGGVAVNSTTVLSAIKNDAASAGLGFFGDSRYLCDRLNLSRDATLVSNADEFSPIQLTRGAAADTIDIVYGSRVESGANILLNAASDTTTAQLKSYLPVAAGQAVLLAPETPASGAAPCVVRTVTANTPSTDETYQELAFANTGTYNKVAFGTNPGFVERDRITLLGDLRWNRYRVAGGNLELFRPLDNATAVLVRDVIAFRAQYGVAPVGGTTLEQWVDPTGAWAEVTSANIARVRAIRIGMIVRSPQKEKVDASGNCNATEVKPTLFGAAAENLDNADWNCWRYRTAAVVVPLRNLVMGQK